MDRPETMRLRQCVGSLAEEEGEETNPAWRQAGICLDCGRVGQEAGSHVGVVHTETPGVKSGLHHLSFEDSGAGKGLEFAVEAEGRSC